MWGGCARFKSVCRDYHSSWAGWLESSRFRFWCLGLGFVCKILCGAWIVSGACRGAYLDDRLGLPLGIHGCVVLLEMGIYKYTVAHAALAEFLQLVGSLLRLVKTCKPTSSSRTCPR